MRAALVMLAIIAAGCSKQSAEETAAAPAAPQAAEAAAAEAAPAEAAPAAFDPWPEGFPARSADYSGVYQLKDGAAEHEVTIAASGAKQRLAFPPGSGLGGAKGDWAQVMVNEGAGGGMMMWPEGAGAPAIATKISMSDLGAAASALGIDEATKARATKTGEDKVAGERCGVYSFTTGDEGEEGSACVTRDGIPLRVVSGGETVMLAKSVSRGAQDASLFAPPAGYEVVDMGECMRLSAEMMGAMRSGQMPDMAAMEAKMKRCETLGAKMGEMFGEQ